MYTVLVVDDEAIVCQGIKEFLEASNLNISQVLTAWNGYEALDYLRMESVDLVLTDIQMDGMNGIELMESILSEKPEIPVVVISAYDAFEYAQKCIRLGARDYLIKPVQLNQLTEVVDRELSKRDAKFKLLMEDSLEAKFSMSGLASLRTYILNEMITVPFEDARDYPYIFEQINIPLEGGFFSVFVIELLWKTGYSLRDRNLYKYAAVNIVEESLKDWRVLPFYGQGNRIVTILQFSESEEEIGSQTEAISKMNLAGRMLIDNFRQHLHMDAVIGISPLQQGLKALPGCYKDALEATKWQGLYENHHVFYAGDFSFKKAQTDVDWLERTGRIVEWMRIGTKQQNVRETINRFVEDISSVFDSGDSTAGIPLSIAYRIYATLLEMKETVGDRYKDLDPLIFFHFPMAGHELKKWFTEYLFETAGLIHTAMIDHDQAIVQQAVRYIRENYRHKGLKIQDVADHVHLSPNYLSFLFKQISGETIWEFVTKVRMEEAKQLLRNTAKRRYEIADEVGYESPEHFTRVFKRFFGESPNMVRN